MVIDASLMVTDASFELLLATEVASDFLHFNGGGCLKVMVEMVLGC